MNCITVESTNILHHIVDDESPEKVNYNVDLTSFYNQLAEDSGSRGFKILEVKGDKTRLKKRSSAPAAISSFKSVQFYFEPTHKKRQSCPVNPSTLPRRFSFESDDDFVLLDQVQEEIYDEVEDTTNTIFDDALENVFHEVDGILAGQEDEAEEPWKSSMNTKQRLV